MKNSIKRASVIILALCMLALTLFGCGGKASEEEIEAAFVGAWHATDINGTSVENSNSLFTSSKDVAITLASDHSATITFTQSGLLVGTQQTSKSGTWDASDTNKVTINIEGSEATATVSDGVMVISQDGATITLKR